VYVTACDAETDESVEENPDPKTGIERSIIAETKAAANIFI